MTAKEYFDKEYGADHIKKVIEMDDMISLYGLMEEYAAQAGEVESKDLYINKLEKAVKKIPNIYYDGAMDKEWGLSQDELDEKQEQLQKKIDKLLSNASQAAERVYTDNSKVNLNLLKENEELKAKLAKTDEEEDYSIKEVSFEETRLPDEL